jgi:hypothetical protein
MSSRLSQIILYSSKKERKERKERKEGRKEGKEGRREGGRKGQKEDTLKLVDLKDFLF